MGAKEHLTRHLNVYTLNFMRGQPPKPDHLRRSKLVNLRLTPSENADLKRASRKLREPVAAILRKGARLYIESKDGSLPTKETK